MSESVDLNDHYMNLLVPEEIADYFLNEDGLSYEEGLLQQASMYQSFQERPRNNNIATRGADINDHGHFEGEFSRSGDILARLALDEALAKSLQELGDEFDGLLLPEHIGNSSGSAESPIATPTREQGSSSNSRQDPVDPDNMQYEELLELTESVGVVNQGIPASRISELPTSKYKSHGFFSKYKKKEKCVICQMNYNSGEQMITLPCLHRYHSKCISDWLMLKKNCPVCQKEVV